MIDDGDDRYRLRAEALMRALVETFGDRALDVARRQYDMMGADSAGVWRDVVGFLED